MNSRAVPLVSFELASNRPDFFAALCGNLHQTAADPTCLEVLVAIDRGDQAMQSCIAEQQALRPFRIAVLEIPADGYFNLWRHFDALHALGHPQAYYVNNINDEIRFLKPGWDDSLRAHQGVYSDHLFRLRISVHKQRNYVDFWECGYAPENYAFYTRAWIDIQGGWNACHGPDAFQQFVVWYLTRTRFPERQQHHRDIVIWDIPLSGEGMYRHLEPAEVAGRLPEGRRAWYRLVAPAMQRECARRARRLQAHIEATAAGHSGFRIVDADGMVAVLTPGGDLLNDAAGHPLRYAVHVPAWRIGIVNAWRRPCDSYWCGGPNGGLRDAMVDAVFRTIPLLRRLLWPHRRVVKQLISLPETLARLLGRK